MPETQFPGMTVSGNSVNREDGSLKGIQEFFGGPEITLLGEQNGGVDHYEGMAAPPDELLQPLRLYGYDI